MTARKSVTVAGYVLPSWRWRPYVGRIGSEVYAEWIGDRHRFGLFFAPTFFCWTFVDVRREPPVIKYGGVDLRAIARAATKKIDQMRAALAGEKGRKR